jgi:hypothetical protein
MASTTQCNKLASYLVLYLLYVKFVKSIKFQNFKGQSENQKQLTHYYLYSGWMI